MSTEALKVVLIFMHLLKPPSNHYRLVYPSVSPFDITFSSLRAPIAPRSTTKLNCIKIHYTFPRSELTRSSMLTDFFYESWTCFIVCIELRTRSLPKDLKGQVTSLKLCLKIVCMSLIIPRLMFFRPRNICIYIPVFISYVYYWRIMLPQFCSCQPLK